MALYLLIFRLGDGGGFPVGPLLLLLLALPVRVSDDMEVREAVLSRFPCNLRLTTLMTVPALEGLELEGDEEVCDERSTLELRSEGGADVGTFVEGDV